MTDIRIVIPCFNEAARFDPSRFAEFVARHPEAGFVLVDDGSTDATLEQLRSLQASSPDHFDVLVNEVNAGKAESVRRGMLLAADKGPHYIGYWDADLATPLEEILRFAAQLDSHERLLLVMGARVKLLGWEIHRNELRHYFGRIFATLASMTLGLGVYDTQCGAKLFRSSPLLRELLDQPFISDWIFDVEILARLVARCRRNGDSDPAQLVTELPVERWEDVPGSKVGLSAAPRALVDLCRIYWTYLRRS